MSERLRKRIDALRVEYVKTFEEEAVGFETELSSRNREGLARRAHRIGGTAGSYQLDEVCGAAQNVERLCESQDEVRSQQVLESEVQRLCEVLRAASAFGLAGVDVTQSQIVK